MSKFAALPHARLNAALTKAHGAISKHTRKADMSGADLAAGGLKAPRQGRFRAFAANTAKALFRKLPVEVSAMLLSAPITIDTLEGKMEGAAGDWLVTGVAGEQYAVNRGIFQETFEPVDPDAKELWAQAYEAATPELPAAKAEPAPPPAPEAATPPPETGPAPQPQQRDFRGIPVVIDRPKGYVQEGTDATGKAWRRVYHVDYGYVPGTKGGDGEGLDVFLGGDADSLEAHWILQRKADGAFDEYKIMLGFADAESAKAMYVAHVPKRFFGSMTTMDLEMMKALLGIEPVANVAKVLEGLRGIIESASKADDDAGDEWLERRIARMRARLGKAEETEKSVRIAKAGPTGGSIRYVMGIVLEPEVVDAQGDVYSEDEVRKSAWQYMVNYRNVGLMHKGLINGKVHLVESWIAPCDMQVEGSTIRKGTWMMGLNVADEEIWTKVQSGALTGLSIGGFSRKDPVA